MSFNYDIDGVRSSKTKASTTIDYTTDKNRDYAQVVLEKQNNQTVASYTYGDDLISQNVAGGTSYFGYDGLGSTKFLTNDSGAITDTYQYDAYGEVTAKTGNTDNIYLFTGEQYDRSLNQYYLRARYYNQGVGRFTQMDTWQGKDCTPVTLNKYMYANAAPTRFVDPTGNFGFSIGGLMSGLRTSMTMAGNTARFAIGGKKGGTSIVKHVSCQIGVAYLKKQYVGDGNQGHHSIPKNLGGKHDQDLIYLPANTHRMFHWVLHVLLKNDPDLKGMGNWTSTANWDSISQTKAGRKKSYMVIFIKHQVLLISIVSLKVQKV